MSWNRDFKGTPAEVKNAIQTEPHMPAQVQQAIGSILDAFDPDHDVAIATNGHINTDGPRVGTVNVAVKVSL